MIYHYKKVVIKTANGVSKAVVEQLITFNDYKNTLTTNASLVRNVVSIRSFNQQLITYKHTTIALTSVYDNMKMLDSINCEPYGYIKHENDGLTNILINAVEN